MHSYRNHSRRKQSTAESSYSSSRFEDTDDAQLTVSHNDSSIHRNSRIHKTSSRRYKSRSQDRRHTSSVHDDYHESRNHHRDDDWRPSNDSRYQREPNYRNPSSYDYDSSVNNWAPRPLTNNHVSHQSARRDSDSRDWRGPSGSDYSHNMHRFPDQHSWDDVYDDRNETFDRWTPSLKERGSRTPQYEYEGSRDVQRPKEVTWAVDEWRPPAEGYDWPSEQRNNKEDRAWIPREESQDRTWKPASSWQPPQERGDSSVHRRRHQQHKSNRTRKGWSQQPRNHAKQGGRRERAREDVYEQVPKHSPSLSPAASYRSPRRSRSRSQTPKRRRVDLDPYDRHEPSPREYEPRREPRHQQYYRSPTSPTPKKHAHRFKPRSPSRSVSRSASPDAKPASRHRLPLITHSGDPLNTRKSLNNDQSPISTEPPDMPPPRDLHWHPDVPPKPDPQQSRHQHASITESAVSAKNSSSRNGAHRARWDEVSAPESSGSWRSEVIVIKGSQEDVRSASPRKKKNIESSSTRFHDDANLKRFFSEEDDESPSSSLDAVKLDLQFKGTLDSLETERLNVPAGNDLNVPNSGASHSSHQVLESRPVNIQPHQTYGPETLARSPEVTASRADSVDHEMEFNDKTAQELFQIVSQVGEGTFGKVYKARNTASGIFVALKKIRMEGERDGFPVTAMREIKLLQSLQHVNIIRLHEMMVSQGHAHMVFEYMDHDLTGILGQTQFTFSQAHLKSLCRQMLCGLSYLHQKGVIHRDIKGSNILVNNRGELKLADFGLARFYHKRRRADYTNRVITLWYRPPELLLGASVYGPEVDMWSAGCIMLELFTKKPVFQGNDEIHQLEVLYKILGTPTPNDWPAVYEMPWYELVKPQQALKNRFREFFHKWLSPAAIDLAQSLLLYDPERRVTAADALQAPYFKTEEPSEELPVGLSSLDGEWHEYEHKRERARRKRLDA